MPKIFRKLSNKFRKGVMFIRRALIQKLGLVSDQFFFLDSHMLSRREKGVDRLDIYSSSKELEYYGVLNNQLIKNFFPERYVYKINNTVIDPLSGFIYDMEGIFIAESSAWYILRNFYSWPKPFIRIPKKKLKGKYIYLHDIGYWHWLIEDLPPFLEAYKRYPESVILTPSNPSTWHQAFLDSLDNAQILYLDAPVQVEELILVGKTAGQGNPLFGLTPHPEDISVLRDHFKPFLNSNTYNGENLFISRSGESRCPKNIKEVESFMHSKGYKVINTNLKLSIFDQMAIFSSAKKVIGIHGAALANIIWCQKGTEIVELASQGYIPPAFSMISSIRSLKYSFFCYGNVPTDMIEISKLEPFV